MKEKGLKFDDEKLQMDLLSVKALFGVTKILNFGAKKYSSRNWENGIRYGRVEAALLRHLLSWWDGEDINPETEENHIYHVLCNAMFLAHYVSNPEKYAEFDDRPQEKEKNVKQKKKASKLSTTKKSTTNKSNIKTATAVEGDY